MATGKKKYWLILGAALFVAYIFAAALPVGRETVLSARWLSSLESGYPTAIGSPAASESDTAAIPFTLGGHFGYVASDGTFALNHTLEGSVSFSADRWAEYPAEPETIEVYDPRGEKLFTIDNSVTSNGLAGYPLFLNGDNYIIGKARNSIAALDGEGKLLWKYDFAAPLTCIDSGGGLLLAGSLDGVVEVLDGATGKRVFYFEPGGSRLSVICGCAISDDGRRFGIVSGVDDQRFLVFERYGDGEYQVVFHEFIGDGFRRAVYVSFIDGSGGSSRIVYEREGGLGIYDIGLRRRVWIPVEGEIAALNGSGGDGLLFVISALDSGRKILTAVRLPDRVIMKAPFKSDTAFLGRQGRRLYFGGGHTLAAFDLEEK